MQESDDAPPQAPPEAPGPSAPAPAEARPEEIDGLDELIGADQLIERGQAIVLWARDNLLTFDVALQAAILFIALISRRAFRPAASKIHFRADCAPGALWRAPARGERLRSYCDAYRASHYHAGRRHRA